MCLIYHFHWSSDLFKSPTGKSELLETLKETKQTQEEKIVKLEALVCNQNIHLQEMNGVAAMNKYLERHNADLQKRVEQLEHFLFKSRTTTDA